MTLDYHFLFNIFIGIFSSILGWILRVVWEAQQKLAQDIKDIEIRLSQDFVRREDHIRAIDQLHEQVMDRFDRLENRLEHYFNNMKGLH